jgi:hypothetical protein
VPRSIATSSARNAGSRATAASMTEWPRDMAIFHTSKSMLRVAAAASSAAAASQRFKIRRSQ